MTKTMLAMALCGLFLVGCKGPGKTGPANQADAPIAAPTTASAIPPATAGLEPDAESPNTTHSRRKPRAQAVSTPGVFDFYVFNLSWSPEFCATHPTSPECPQHLGFIVHGLWPQNTDGSFPEDCSNQPGPTDTATLTDLYPDPSLIAHEWTTHGTCSGLTANPYFALIRQAFNEVRQPTQITGLKTGTSLTPAAILADFTLANPAFPKASFSLSCGNNELTAIEVCMSKTLQPIACSGLKSCRANTVKIVPRGSGN